MIFSFHSRLHLACSQDLKATLIESAGRCLSLVPKLLLSTLAILAGKVLDAINKPLRVERLRVGVKVIDHVAHL